MDAPCTPAHAPVQAAPVPFQGAALDTPDDAHRVLSAASWEPVPGGWRDPDAGEVVPWWEAVRRARRRVP